MTFKAIQELLKMNGQELVPFENIQDEIFDMVKPEQPDRITLKDLLRWLVIICSSIFE